MNVPKIAILGGGIAGLAAALALAEEGFAVSLYEKKSLLGGRASSFVDPTNQDLVDNCQHVLMRCCTNLEDFYRRIGADRAITFSRRIEFLDREGHCFALKASPLPAPLHLFPALLRFPSLRFWEKMGILRATWKILRLGPDAEGLDSIDFLSWLQGERQSQAAIERFWRPILVSALNEELDRASAKGAFHVIYEGILKNRRGYEIGLPSVRLAEIYSDCGLKALREKGVEVSLQKSATRIHVSGDGHGFRVDAIHFSDGSQVAADYYLSTIPFHGLVELLPAELLRKENYFSKLQKMETSPIAGIHLWFDRPVMDQDFVALLGRQMQWVFNKSNQIDGQKGQGSYVNLVVSAARDLDGLSKERILSIALEDLRESFPLSRGAKLLKSLVIREKNATFSPCVGAEELRPRAKTPVSGLYLAGDWTKTGWPATMEGAVRSGYQAAEAILLERGIVRRLVRPNLPAQGLSSWLRRKNRVKK